MRTRSQGPFLRRHYPASSVIRPCPTPAVAAALRDVEAATLTTNGSPPINSNHLSDVPCPLPRRIKRVHCRLLPRWCSLPPKGVHNAGRLKCEVMITYPFHPLVGQSVLVVSDKKHGGIRYLIICKPGEGSRVLLPEWMTSREAAAIQTVSCPRLSMARLVELRALIDRLMALSPENHTPGGGQSNEAMEATPTRPVHDIGGTLRATTSSANDGRETAQDASGGDVVGHSIRTRPC